MLICQNDEMVTGWPLGLSFMNMRLRVVESLPPAAASSSVEPPYQSHIPSTSFSSFSTSNLDTESTASFFQDKSVSLAQLLGFRTDDRGRLYFPKSLRFEERNMILENGSCSNGTKVQEKDVAKVICIPVLLDALLKIIKSKKSSRN
ncbi:uncharacterized protein At3g17950-like isoform X1 [Vicia villosa]|uniref:uncharacterized protein At3g17950-like isoform X1 n=1 Tax=Vicia villosa TaxID=3911 RepID=UPI00273AB0ED|nr:uncharacterized protein At3g17950-like isoform X1 [Vicia villosa]